MANIKNMTSEQMAEYMGDVATASDGMAMLVLMRERGYADTEDVPEDEWHKMLKLAVATEECADGYDVIRHPEGGAAEYVGHARDLVSAYALASKHEDGRIEGTPEHLWETARASRSRVRGCDYPDVDPEEEDPAEWYGRDGCYGIYEVRK